MISRQGRDSSGSELVFSVLRTLMIAYQLWGTRSSVALSALGGVMGATEAELSGVLAYLASEGLVCFDELERTARLTLQGAHKLLHGIAH